MFNVGTNLGISFLDEPNVVFVDSAHIDVLQEQHVVHVLKTYADVKARCARIVTRLEAIATDPNATPADPRDLFIRLQLLSYELRGATFRVRECWWPTSNGGVRP